MRRVLVTGGAGMIGRRVAVQLVSAGDVVQVVDDLSSGLPMPGSVEGIVADIRDGDRLAGVFREFRPHAVVHLAALHHIPTCEKERVRCLDVNVSGTENVLSAAEQSGVERVVLASSGAVYGWAEGALGEDVSAIDAADNYGLTKLCNERQLRFWCERTGGSGRVARIFNTIAHDDPNAHLIPDVLAQLQGGGDGITTVRLGNLAPRRDYVHADDVATGLRALLDDHRQDVAFDVFNLCSGVEHSVEAMVGLVARIMDCRIRVETSAERRRRVDRPSQLGDPGKASAILGWRVTLDLAAALRRLIEARAALAA